MDLFTYLMANKKKKIFPHKGDLFSYLLATHKIPLKTITGTLIEIIPKVLKINNFKLTKESTQETTTGKNLLNSSTNTNDYYINASGIPTPGAGHNYTQLIAVQQGIYTFSGIQNRTNSTNTKRIHGYDSAGNWVEQITFLSTTTESDPTTYSTTFTINNINISYIRLSYYNDDTNVMLNFGNTAGDYEPYTGGIPAPNPLFPMEVNTIKTSVNVIISDGTNSKTITIPLGNNEVCGIGNYKDELIVDKTGHCYLNKKIGKVVLDGSEDYAEWGTSPDWIGAYIINFVPYNATNGTDIRGISNYFPIGAGTMATSDYDCIGFRQIDEQKIWYFVLKHNFTNLADFKAWLQTHNTDVYYVLETPNLIDLNYTVDMTLYEGTNIITNSETGTMEIKYY